MRRPDALKRGPAFFLLLRVVTEPFFSPLFPSGSHQVPQVPKFFPQDVPNNTSNLSHMVCTKFNWNSGL